MRPERYRRLQAVLDRRQPDLTVLMERVNKAHNLAAVLRSCDAVGILEAHCVPATRPVEPDAHTSAGTHKWIRVHAHATVADAADTLRSRGFRLLAAHPSAGALDYREADYTGPTAILIGAELDGLSDHTLSLADRTVAIPMEGMVRSLNVSVATALLLFEAARQRSAAGLYDHPRIEGERRQKLLFQWAYPRLARHLDRIGHAYPELDDQGALVGPMPGSAGTPLRPVDRAGSGGTPPARGSRT